MITIIHSTFNNLNQSKKERILNAAKREFINKGFDHAKVQSICTLAEIPRSAFYRYFDSLEDCLEALFENMRESKIEKVKHLIDKNHKDKLDISVQILEDILEDEETFLLMMSLIRSETFNLPMIQNMKQYSENFQSKEAKVIKESLQRVIRGIAEEHYTQGKPKEDCIEEYKIFLEIIKKGLLLHGGEDGFSEFYGV